MNEDKKPKRYDVVLGGSNPPSIDGLVLGGIEGSKLRFAKANSDEDKIGILKDASKSGEVGEDWLFEILHTETGETQWIAAVMLSEIANQPYQRLFYQPERESNQNQIVSVIKKDTKRTLKPRADLDKILDLVPNNKEQVLVDYFKNLIIDDLEKWNTWRKNYSEHMLYLRGVDLSESDLSSINLSKVNLVQANLHKADLRESNLTQSCLCHANLSQANLDEANLNKVDFRKANLQNAKMSGRNIQRSHFGEANLIEADCYYSCFVGSNFTKANFTKASLIYSDLRKVIIHKTNFYETNFRRANISGLDFKGLNIRCANFARSTRTKTNFKGAYFKGAHFRNDYYEPGWE